MAKAIEIENIEHMRRRAGIDDVELRDAIRQLRVGDHVRLTFLASFSPFAGELLTVRITRIQEDAFRGKLAESPVSAGLAQLKAGSMISFTGDHIHSITKWVTSDAQ